MPVFQNPELEGGPYSHQGGKTGILIIHGFTATTTEVRLLAKAFIPLGLTISAPLLPGHGTTPQDLNCKKYQDWTRCVENAYNQLKQHCDKIIVGGESMGAVLSLYLAEQHPDISALLIYSPAIHVDKLKYARYFKWFRPIMNKSNNDKDDKTWQGYTVYPMRAAHELFKLQKVAEMSLSKVSQPALILQGLYDRTIDKSSSSLIYNAIQSDVKELYYLKHSGHVMLLGNEIEWIINKSISFLKNADIL